jgi:hypothetical protein
MIRPPEPYNVTVEVHRGRREKPKTADGSPPFWDLIAVLEWRGGLKAPGVGEEDPCTRKLRAEKPY